MNFDLDFLAWIYVNPRESFIAIGFKMSGFLADVRFDLDLPFLRRSRA